MPISCYFRDCKALLVTSLTVVRGSITSVQTFKFTSEANVACEKCMAWGSSAPGANAIIPNILHCCGDVLSIVKFKDILLLNGSGYRHEANFAREKSFLKMYDMGRYPQGPSKNAKYVGFFGYFLCIAISCPSMPSSSFSAFSIPLSPFRSPPISPYPFRSPKRWTSNIAITDRTLWVPVSQKHMKAIPSANICCFMDMPVHLFMHSFVCLLPTCERYILKTNESIQ